MLSSLRSEFSEARRAIKVRGNAPSSFLGAEPVLKTPGFERALWSGAHGLAVLGA
jgi:hypothetical protein